MTSVQEVSKIDEYELALRNSDREALLVGGVLNWENYGEDVYFQQHDTNSKGLYNHQNLVEANYENLAEQDLSDLHAAFGQKNKKAPPRRHHGATATGIVKRRDEWQDHCLIEMNDGLEDVFCHRHRCQGKALPPAGTKVRFKLHLSSKSLCWQSGFVCWEGAEKHLPPPPMNHSPSSDLLAKHRNRLRGQRTWSDYQDEPRSVRDDDDDDLPPEDFVCDPSHRRSGGYSSQTSSFGEGADDILNRLSSRTYSTMDSPRDSRGFQHVPQQTSTSPPPRRFFTDRVENCDDDDEHDERDDDNEEWRRPPAKKQSSVETWAASVMGILDGKEDNWTPADRALLSGAGLFEDEETPHSTTAIPPTTPVAPSTFDDDDDDPGYHQTNPPHMIRLGSGIASPLLDDLLHEYSGPTATPKTAPTSCPTPNHNVQSPIALLNAESSYTSRDRPPSAPSRAMMMASPRMSPRTPPPPPAMTPRSEPLSGTPTDHSSVQSIDRLRFARSPIATLDEEAPDRISLRVVSVDEPKLPWLATAELPPSRAASVEELKANLGAAVEAGNASAIQKLKRRRETRKRAKRGDHCRVEVRLDNGYVSFRGGSSSPYGSSPPLTTEDPTWWHQQQRRQPRTVRIDAYAVNAAGAGAALRAMLDANAAALQKRETEPLDREEMFRNLGWAELIEQLKLILARCEPDGICCNHLSRAFEKEFGSALVETLFGDFESLAALLRAPQLQHVVRLSESPGKPDLAVFLAKPDDIILHHPTTHHIPSPLPGPTLTALSAPASIAHQPHKLRMTTPTASSSSPLTTQQQYRTQRWEPTVLAPPMPHLLDDQCGPFTYSPPPRMPTTMVERCASASAASPQFIAPIAPIAPTEGPRLPTDFFRPINAAETVVDADIIPTPDLRRLAISDTHPLF